MKEELQSKLVEILTSIQTAAGKASDFAMEQLPDVAMSYLMYGRAWATLEAATLLLLFALGVWGNFRFVRWMRQEDAWEASPLIVLTVGAAGGLGFFGMSALKGAFFVWFAPKVWLLKEIASLLK